MMWHRPDGFTLGGSGCAHLKVEGLAAGYGPVQVLRGLRFEARPGLTVILGPNGAGKTTLLRALAGLIPRGGEVLLDGEELPEKTFFVPATTIEPSDISSTRDGLMLCMAGMSNPPTPLVPKDVSTEPSTLYRTRRTRLV